MILKYLDTILTVYPIEFIPEAASGLRQPEAPMALALSVVSVKADLVDLG